MRSTAVLQPLPLAFDLKKLKKNENLRRNEGENAKNANHATNASVEIGGVAPPPPGGETTNKTNFIELLSGDGEESNYEKDYVVTDLKNEIQQN